MIFSGPDTAEYAPRARSAQGKNYQRDVPKFREQLAIAFAAASTVAVVSVCA
jgi:hypothetical protein